MKTPFFAIALLFLAAGTGCRKKPATGDNASLPVFHLGAAISKQVPDTFTWNSIAKRITYLPVSTSPDALFGSVRLIHSDDNYYYMADFTTNSIFRTDKTGKILHSFSRIGQGPGEYARLTYVYANSEDSTIQVFDQRGHKYLVYDLTGNLIRETRMDEKGVDTPIFISNDYAVVKASPEADYKLCITDKELNIKKNLFPFDTTCTEMERLVLTWQINWNQNRDRAFVHYADEDTVYTITANGAHPLCIIQKGAYKLPAEEARQTMELTPEGSPYIRTMRLASVPDYYLISYMLKNRIYEEVWSKADNRIVSRFSNENGEPGYPGYPFRLPSGKKIRISTSSVYIDDKTVALFIPAATAAEERLADVGEDDNPVMVLLEL